MVARVPPERVVLVVPRDRERYDWFAWHASQVLPRPLPPYPWLPRTLPWGRKGFQVLGSLKFGSDWAPWLEPFHLRHDEPSHAEVRREFARCLAPFIARVAAAAPLTAGAEEAAFPVRRFTPPPNWPPPPPGWVPPPGRVADPG